MTVKSVKSIIDRPRIDKLPEWKALASHRKKMGRTSLTELFAADRRRGTRCSTEALGIHFDWSKHLVDAETMKLLFALARAAGVEKHRNAMFKGEKINITEDRAVLHTALRAPADAVIEVDGENVVPAVHEVLRRMGAFANKIRRGRWLGHSGRPIRNVVNIGIGGSDLGPAMAYDALRKYSDRGLTVRFVSNVDANDFHEKTLDLDPEETLFIVCSKTFTTLETMTNAHTARKWVLKAFDGDATASAKHFVAVSTNAEEVAKFGIDTRNMFGFWDWVGGRYSVTSAIGIVPIALQFGYEAAEQFLAGARDIDEHVVEAPLASNIPCLLGVLAVWNVSFLDIPSRAVLPYSQALARFPAHIQQVDMESNGKRVSADGVVLPYGAGEFVFGEPGTNGQHSFYQLLHQGRPANCEFIGYKTSPTPMQVEGKVANHDELMSNFFAQPDALAFGKTEEQCAAEGIPPELVSHKVFEGNRPSSQILIGEMWVHCCFCCLCTFPSDSVSSKGVRFGAGMRSQSASCSQSTSTAPSSRHGTNGVRFLF
ncbi:MAG: glucose-6-phosphate isomerase [Planctomycetaceae bacterium]|nr:glucose-6-phosphate isomerase [Planctomycetaceae bacterium]